MFLPYKLVALCVAVVSAPTPVPNSREVGPFLGTASLSGNPNTPIPPSFLGLAHEWIPFAWTQGSTQQGVDPVYVQLLKNIFDNAAGPLNFRVGGNTQDNLHGPLPATLVSQIAALQQELGAQIVLGVDLKSNNAGLSAGQAQAGAAALPAGALVTVELGNEPDNYPLTGPAYLDRFAQIATSVQQQVPIPLGGPSYSGLIPLNEFVQFATEQKARLNLLELHGYTGWAGNAAIDIDYLLNEAQSAGWAATYGQYVQPAHALGLPVRISEMNSLWGFGKPGVSDTFGAALWVTDILFELMAAGFDGVNFTGSSNQVYAAIQDLPDPNSQGRLSRIGAPYYGMLLFARATAHGGSLLPTQQTGSNHVKVWATQDPAGQTRIALLNKDSRQGGLFQLTGLPAKRVASAAYLVSPSITATHGISFAGQTYEGSTTGHALGEPAYVKLTDDGNGNYVVPLGPYQAVLLTFDNSQ